jgi:hypothetical protein
MCPCPTWGARASRGTRELVLSVAACALAGRGPWLVADTYAGWTEPIRDSVAADLEPLQRPDGPAATHIGGSPMALAVTGEG